MFYLDKETGYWNYTKDENDEIVGVLYGHFAPFTGPNGHGRLIKKLQTIGAKKFVIGMPESGEKLDKERYMFNTYQRKEIIEKALKEMGVDFRIVLCRPTSPEKTFRNLGNSVSKMYGQNTRPVFIFGPDREEDFGKFLTPFESEDETKFEYIIEKSRGKDEVSGTLVRELIRNNDAEAVEVLTGYSKEIVDFLLQTWSTNVKILDKRGSVDGNAMSGKHSIEHLYNDNKTQMSTSDFIKLLKFIKSKGGFITTEDFDISEKIDGSSSFIGYDDFGFYFSKFGISIKMRKEEDVGGKFRGFFKSLIDSKVADILKYWRQKENCADIKVQLENVLPEASRDGESVQAVLVKYDKSKIGKGLCVTIQALADGIPIENEELKNDVITCLQGEGFNAVTSTKLNPEPIDLNNIIEEAESFIENPKTIRANGDVIKELQKETQEEILANFTEGNFGKDFEGLVFISKNGEFCFKTTSSKFKDLMNAHNRRTK